VSGSHRHGLRWQLTLSYLLLVGLTVIILSLVTLWVTRRGFDAFVSETGRRKGQMLALFFAGYYQSQGGSWAGVRAAAEKLVLPSEKRPPGVMPAPRTRVAALWRGLRLQPGDRVLLADRDGRVLADTEGKDLGQVLPEGMLARGNQVTVGGRQVGTVVVGAQMGLLGAIERAYLRRLNQALLLVAVLVGTVALVFGAMVAQRITKPVRELASAATRLASEGAGDPAQRSHEPLPVRSGDELGEMSAAFNTMVSRLEEQSRLRRQMVADIAHELRTPLSVMQLELEALEDGLQSPVDATAGLRGEIDLLTQLVEDLALLARTDADEQPLNLILTDMAELTRETIARWQGRATARGLTLRTTIPPDLTRAWIDPLRITRVLTNLLDNALRHTPEGGEVVVGMAAQQDALRVSVRDTGQGIPPDELENVFKRFYRLDPARSRASGGRGLGLAIARQIVELHGGRIWAESSGVPGEGTTIRFTLPLQPKGMKA